MNEKNNEQRLIQSVQRSFNIIDTFSLTDTELALNEISQKTGLNKTTVFGLLKTLSANGYIYQNEDNSKYRLGIKLLEKGALVSDSLDIRSISKPYLKKLTDMFSETTNLCLYQQGSVYIVDKMEAPNAYIIMSSKLGRKLPFHSSASGKIILANLEEAERKTLLGNIILEAFTENTLTNQDNLSNELELIRKQGYSLEEEETERGTTSIATPIFNHRRKAIGSISLSGVTIKVKENMAEIIKELVHSSRLISKEIGFN